MTDSTRSTIGRSSFKIRNTSASQIWMLVSWFELLHLLNIVVNFITLGFNIFVHTVVGTHMCVCVCDLKQTLVDVKKVSTGNSLYHIYDKLIACITRIPNENWNTRFSMKLIKFKRTFSMCVRSVPFQSFYENFALIIMTVVLRML